ncbi:MAG: NGG1p interacting factor 3 protein [Planctomycetaceae bacterium]|nr:NGG1p interacting factor 3 protein [Planctomycetaceae bacterium]
MPTIADISRFLGDFAPLPLAEPWDNVGLLVGHSSRQVNRIVTCLTITPDVATEAIELGAELIVSHHPVLFKPVQKLVSTDAQAAMLLQLIEAGVAIYSPHTAFDSALGGINQQLAVLFSLEDIQPLRIKATAGPGERPGEAAGAGRHGKLSVTRTLTELCELTKIKLRIRQLQFVGEPQRKIQRLAIACGAAAEFIPDAIFAGCEALIVGEARFHDCLRARDSGLALILPGHYATERPAVEAVAKLLQATFPETVVTASLVESDPVKFG